MADVKLSLPASSDLTVTLASLATSSTLVAGRESTAVDNGTNLYLDYLLGGKITTGTSPTTAKEIRVYVYGSVNDTPTFPDVIDGTDSAETMTSTDIRDAGLKLAAIMSTDATSNRTYWFAPVSVAALFGGTLPDQWGVWITHDTAVNLNSTGSNHAISIQPVFETVT